MGCLGLVHLLHLQSPTSHLAYQRQTDIPLLEMILACFMSRISKPIETDAAANIHQAMLSSPRGQEGSSHLNE